MNTQQISEYVGLFKNPLQQMELDKPTMYIVCDKMKSEADLILLTPGTFLHAYEYLTELGVLNIRVFVPSLRPEFISDVFNLYMSKRFITPIKWVFPDKPFYPHTEFEFGQVKTMNYINEYDSSISISYVKNDNADDIYDIIVRDEKSCNYFSQYLTEEKLFELYEDPEYTSINIPYSSTLFGGLTYKEISSTYKKKFLNKLNPHSFMSFEEYALYTGNIY